MNDLPIEDINNAIRYAQTFIILHRHQTQATDPRWRLPPFHLKELPLIDESFHLPPALREEFKLVTLVFDEEGCRQLSCFRYKENGVLCTAKDDPMDLLISDRVYPACQKACQEHRLEESPILDEVRFVGGKCLRQNTLFKKWCLFPTTRTDDSSADAASIPPFVYDDETEDCHFTQAYCDRYGLQFDQTCQRSSTQAFVEDYLVGQTIYRSYGITQAAKKRRRRQKRETSSEVSEHMLSQLLKETSFDLGVDAAFWSARQLALKSIPLYSTPAIKIVLAQLQTTLGKNVAKHAVTAAVVHSIRTGLTVSIAIKAATALGTASTGVGLVLLGIQVAGLIVDAIDPHRLNDLVDANWLRQIKIAYEAQFHTLLEGKLEVEPLGLMSILSRNEYNEEERIILITRIATYLSHLEVNARGEDLNYESSLTLEAYLEQWVSLLYHQSPAELEKKMDTYFITFSLLSAILVTVFLAVAM